MLDVPLRVDVQPLRQVKFKSCHSVVGRLQAVHDLTLFAVGQLDVVLQVLRPRQEAVEQVDDVPIRVGADHVLGVHPSCCLESKTFARLVLDAKPRLHPSPCKRTVVLQAKARLNDPRATLHRVVHVASELCGVFLLLDRHLQRIERLKVGLHAHHFQAVLHVVLSQDVFEVEAKVEALHLAVPRGRTDFIKVDAVVAQCEMSVQQNGASGRHNGEGSPSAHVSPAVVGKVHPSAVVQHTGVVHKVESKDAELRTIAPAKSDFAVGIGEAKRQPAIVDVRVEQLRRLLEVAVLHAQQVADAARAVFGHGPEWTVNQQFGTKGARPHTAFGFAHVSVARADVHHAADAPTIFGGKGPRVDVRVGQRVGVKHTEKSDAVKGVVNQHAVEQHLVLDGRTTTDVQLPPLVTRGHKTRQHLQGLHQIRGTTKAWNALDVCRTNGLYGGADLGRLFFTVCTNFSPLQGHYFGFKQDVAGQHLAISYLNRLTNCFIFETGDHQGVLTCGNSAQTEVPFHVTGHPIRGAFQRDRGKHHSFS